MTETQTGGCFCGAVRFETRGKPVLTTACSCNWCCKRTGSAFGVSVYFDGTDVSFNDAPRTRFRLVSDAGRWIETEFCPTCATTLSWTLELRPGMRGIAAGAYDQPNIWYSPDRYAFARSKPDWLHIDRDIIFHEAMPG